MTAQNKTTARLYERIYRLVRDIPPGQVASYGQIARLVGCSPRVAGYAMAAVPSGSDVPWQRVINSRGEISPRKGGGGDMSQRRLLEDEGIIFDQKGRLDLSEAGWPGPGPRWFAENDPDQHPI